MSGVKRVFLLMSAALSALALIYFCASSEPKSAKKMAPLLLTAPQIQQPTPSLRSPRKSAVRPEPSVPSPPPPALSFEEPATEEEYWSELEALKRSDKKRALAYALQGEEWYSEQGKPAEARRAMIVTLLVDLGRMDEARERTRSFISHYPNSAYRRLVQGVTGIHPRPGAPPGHQP